MSSGELENYFGNNYIPDGAEPSFTGQVECTIKVYTFAIINVVRGREQNNLRQNVTSRVLLGSLPEGTISYHFQDVNIVTSSVVQEFSVAPTNFSGTVYIDPQIVPEATLQEEPIMGWVSGDLLIVNNAYKDIRPNDVVIINGRVVSHSDGKLNLANTLDPAGVILNGAVGDQDSDKEFGRTDQTHVGKLRAETPESNRKRT